MVAKESRGLSQEATGDLLVADLHELHAFDGTRRSLGRPKDVSELQCRLLRVAVVGCRVDLSGTLRVVADGHGNAVSLVPDGVSSATRQEPNSDSKQSNASTA